MALPKYHYLCSGQGRQRMERRLIDLYQTAYEDYSTYTDRL